VKGGYALMKKVFAIVISVLFFASLCIAVLGCKKKSRNQQRLRKLKLLLHPQHLAHPGQRKPLQNNCVIIFSQDKTKRVSIGLVF